MTSHVDAVTDHAECAQLQISGAEMARHPVRIRTGFNTQDVAVVQDVVTWKLAHFPRTWQVTLSKKNSFHVATYEHARH